MTTSDMIIQTIGPYTTAIVATPASERVAALSRPDRS